VPREDLEVGVDGATLAATLSTPSDRARAPAVVAIQGASSGTRDDPLQEHLRGLLPGAGVAVLSFDRRGEGASTGQASTSFARRAADAAAVVAALRDHRAIDPERVGLWGFSEGGWIVPMVALADRRVAFLTLISTAGVSPERQMAYATARVLRTRGFDDRTVRRVSALRRRLDDAYRRRDQRSMIEEVDAVRDEPWFDDAYLPDPALPEDDAWADVLDLDVAAIVARLDVPVLLTYGEDDRWMPIAESLDAWRGAYRGPSLEVVRIAGTGHTPVHPEDPDDLAERGPIAAEYERALLSFVARVDRR
jgi:pimeloyl-ACP methyl ester carboxylesterase